MYFVIGLDFVIISINTFALVALVLVQYVHFVRFSDAGRLIEHTHCFARAVTVPWSLSSQYTMIYERCD